MIGDQILNIEKFLVIYNLSLDKLLLQIRASRDYCKDDLLLILTNLKLVIIVNIFQLKDCISVFTF